MDHMRFIQTPFGINVFGSSIIRVEPDIVSLNFAVSRIQLQPRDAFNEARKAAQDVRNYLDQANVSEVGASRVGISRTYQFTAGVQKFIGYTAKVTYRVALHQLDRMEDVLAGIVDAGVNEISSVDFQTTRLKEVRADARRRAVQAAREKAENYCAAAGVRLGKLIHIEDVNPDTLHSGEGHAMRETQLEDDSEIQAFDPGSITVRAAVILAFKIEQ